MKAVVLALVFLGCSGDAGVAPAPLATTGSSSPSTTPPPPPPRLPAAAISSHRISCDAEVELVCPPGYELGCGGGRTTYQVCVRVGAKAGSTCDTQIYVQCPEGEINACYANPPYGPRHICVLATRPRGPASDDEPTGHDPNDPARVEFEETHAAYHALCEASSRLGPDQTASQLAATITDPVTRDRARTLVADLEALPLAERRPALEAARERFKLEACPFLATMQRVQRP